MSFTKNYTPFNRLTIVVGIGLVLMGIVVALGSDWLIDRVFGGPRFLGTADIDNFISGPFRSWAMFVGASQILGTTLMALAFSTSVWFTSKIVEISTVVLAMITFFFGVFMVTHQDAFGTFAGSSLHFLISGALIIINGALAWYYAEH